MKKSVLSVALTQSPGMTESIATCAEKVAPNELKVSSTSDGAKAGRRYFAGVAFTLTASACIAVSVYLTRVGIVKNEVRLFAVLSTPTRSTLSLPPTCVPLGARLKLCWH